MYDLKNGNIVYEYNFVNGAQPNGLCYDSVSERFYVTDQGVGSELPGDLSTIFGTNTQAIYVLDKELNLLDQILDSNANLRPNPCIVDSENRIVYFGLNNYEIIPGQDLNLGVVAY